MKNIFLMIASLLLLGCSSSTPPLQFPEEKSERRILFDLSQTPGINTELIFIDDEIILTFFEGLNSGYYYKKMTKYITKNDIDIHNDTLLYMEIYMPIESFSLTPEHSQKRANYFLGSRMDKQLLNQLKNSLTFYTVDGVVNVYNPMHLYWLETLGDTEYSICALVCIKDKKVEELTSFKMGIDYTTYYFDLVNQSASVGTVEP
jgi:hypothetical protein